MQKVVKRFGVTTPRMNFNPLGFNVRPAVAFKENASRLKKAGERGQRKFLPEPPETLAVVDDNLNAPIGVNWFSHAVIIA